jgi:hypothetical protein
MLGDLSIHRRMDRNEPPDEDPLNARLPLDIENQARSPEEPQQANELVPETSGVAPRSGTSEVLDPESLRILGGILIGLILVARVKRFGPVEFYEGIPAKLPDVVRTGLELPPS